MMSTLLIKIPIFKSHISFRSSNPIQIPTTPFSLSLRHVSQHSGTTSMNISYQHFTRLTPSASIEEPFAPNLCQNSEIQDNLDAVTDMEINTTEIVPPRVEVAPPSPVIALLQSYKEALKSNDISKISELEGAIISLDEEKNNFEKKASSLPQEILYESDRILRISADFENFRKRTEAEKYSIVTKAHGDILENLLPILDSFDRAKSHVKVETKGEGKINDSYQSIYKQFVEILSLFHVVPVETIGSLFDPLVHEAIMRAESTEFVEGIVIEEFRKGFKLGDRLLRPAMVKVSSGPGPANPKPAKSEDIKAENS